MHKTFAAATALALLACASPARAQFQPRTTSEPGRISVDVNGAGQFQTRLFTGGDTFTSFGEPGQFTSIQNVGRGGGFDVAAGYRVAKHLRGGVGVWRTESKAAAAGTASIPDPLIIGRYKTVTMSGSDFKQRTVGANLQVIWTTNLASRAELALFLGPSIIGVRQDVAAVTVAPSTQTAVMSSGTQSATTA